MPRITFPADPLQRIRLAFLALGVLALVSGAVQTATGFGEAPLHSASAFVALLSIAAIWSYYYARGTSKWWGDLLIGGALGLYLTRLFLPDLGLGLVYMALYLGALFGTRWDSFRSLAVVLLAYLGAELRVGLLESPVLMQFVAYQVPALVLTGVIMRILHESLVSRRHLTEEIEKMIRMEAVTRLTAGIAHDFNNLLTAIRGTIELALTEIDEGEEAHDDLRVALRTTERAGALTQQLLIFSRSKITHPERVDLNEHVVDLEPMLKHLVGHSIELRKELTPRIGAVVIDPTALEQVVTNLVLNAKEALEEAPSPEPWILLRTYRVRTRALARELETLPDAKELVVLEVRDPGPGIDPGVRHKILEPFVTTKAEGTGLGLSTVYGIVSQAGGQLRIESEAGSGTRVYVYLPGTTATPGPAADPRASEARRPTPSGAR